MSQVQACRSTTVLYPLRSRQVRGAARGQELSAPRLTEVQAMQSHARCGCAPRKVSSAGLAILLSAAGKGMEPRLALLLRARVP